MSPRDSLRQHWPMRSGLLAIATVLVFVAAAAISLFRGGYGDYGVELLPSAQAMLSGNIAGGLEAAPAYGGSLFPRLPTMAIAHWLGGGDLAIFRVGAATFLAAYFVLGAWLVRSAAKRSVRHGWATLAVVAATPVLLEPVTFGHPEELLAATLCVWGVVLARSDRAGAAGVVIGLAVMVKPWAVLALAPAFLISDGRRWRFTACAAASVSAMMAPFLIAAPGGFLSAQHGAATTPSSGIFRAQQLLWPLHQVTSRLSDGVVYSSYTGPRWLIALSHPLIVALSPIFTGVLWARGHREHLRRNALSLLALLLVLRAVLDPWATTYYVVPAIIALTAHEILERRQLPVLALGSLTGAQLSFNAILIPTSQPNLQFIACALWSLPVIVVLAGRLLRVREPHAEPQLNDRVLERGSAAVGALGATRMAR